MKKANLFKPELIEEIQVKCPVAGEEYVCDLNDPDLFCPACGEPHEPKDYMVYYKDGSFSNAKGLYVGKIPETIDTEFHHAEPETEELPQQEETDYGAFVGGGAFPVDMFVKGSSMEPKISIEDLFEERRKAIEDL